MPIHFTVTDRARGADELARKLSAHLDIGPPKFIALFSSSPPEYIELLGKAIFWSPLIAGAVIFLKSYLSKLGDLAAVDTVEFLRRVMKSNEVRPIADVANALVEAKASLGSNGRIIIGINLLNDHTGVILNISDENPVVVAAKLSQFVIRAEGLEALMALEIFEGRAPLGNAILSVEADGSLTVRWIDQGMAGRYEKNIR